MFIWILVVLVTILIVSYFIVKRKINYEKICSKCEHCCVVDKKNYFCWREHSFISAGKCLRSGDFKLKTFNVVREDKKDTEEKDINELIKENAKFFTPENYKEDLPSYIVNGICIMYDTIEDRVVYVGRNDKDNNFIERLGDYFETGKCSLCKSIIDALKNLNNHPATKKQAVNYLCQNIKFAVIEIDDRDVRNKLTYNLINTFACDPNNIRENDWLGRYSSDEKISYGKLWNKEVGRLNGEVLSKEEIELCVHGLVHN